MLKWEEILSKKSLPVWIIGTENISKIRAEFAVISLGIGERFRKNLSFARKYGLLHIGKFKGEKIICANVPAGTLMLESVLKVLSLAGIKRVIGIGATGGLQDNVNIGDIILPTSAFSGEGLSRYYQKDNRLIKCDESIMERLTELSSTGNLPYHNGKIYTTASILSETDDFVEKLKEEGFLGIECEIAAMYLLSQEFNMKAAGLLVITDHPSKKELFENNPIKRTRVKDAFRNVEELIKNYFVMS